MTVWSDEIICMFRDEINSVVEQGNLEVKIYLIFLIGKDKKFNHESHGIT